MHAGSQRLRYDEGCLAAHALNLIGDRWALLVIRELMFTPKRFSLIRAGMPGITASVLTSRLSQMTEAGVLLHDDRLGLYELTAAGKAALPVLEALCHWALCVPGHDPTRFISPSALMISMGAMLRRDMDQSAEATVGFAFTSEAFTMQLGGQRVLTEAVRHSDAPVVLSGNGNQLAAAVYGPQPLTQLVAAGVVGVTGDIALGQAFVDRFRLQA
ncbi:MAG: winged helix-turn-helix transcriptional regulator [Rhodobacterales bacterium]